MAKRKHLKILRQGVSAWNQWRKENPNIKPNLKWANLSKTNLEGADFSRAKILGVNFRKANLAHTDFSYSVAGTPFIIDLILSLICLSFSFVNAFIFHMVAFFGFSGVWEDAFRNLFSAYLSNYGYTYSQSLAVSNFVSIILFFIMMVVVVVGVRRLRNWSIVIGGIFWITLFVICGIGGLEGLGVVADQWNTGQGILLLSLLLITSLSLIYFWILSLLTTFYLDWISASTNAFIIFGSFFLFFDETTTYQQYMGAGFLFLLTMIFLFCLRAVYGNHRYSFLKDMGLYLASAKGTNFKGTDLSHANFTRAKLKNVRFDMMTNMYRTCLRSARKLDFARLMGTQLSNFAVRKLLVNGNGRDGIFRKMNLYGAYLAGADLRNADFSHSILSKADLTEAKMTGMNLHGAVFKEWIVEKADCEYVYMDEVEENPVPFHSGPILRGIKH